MQAEGTSTLGDVNDPVDELGDLADQGCEFVDDDDQGRRTVGVSGLLQGDEVLGALAVEQPLSVGEFCAQRCEGSSDEEGGEVRDQADEVREFGALAEG